MSLLLRHRRGELEADPDPEHLEQVLLELDGQGSAEEFVSLTSEERGISIEAHPDGRTALLDLVAHVARHRLGLSRQSVLALFQLLLRGQTAELEGQAWIPGLGAAGPASVGTSRESEARAAAAEVASRVKQVVDARHFTYLGCFEICHRLVVGSRSRTDATWEGRPLEARKGSWHAFVSHEQVLGRESELEAEHGPFVSEVALCHESVLSAFPELYERAIEVGEVAVDGGHVTLMDSAVFDESTLAASALESGDGAIAGPQACVIRCHEPGHYPLYVWTEEGEATLVSLSLL